MNIRICGNSIDPCVVTIRSLGFGEPIEDAVPYSMVISKVEFATSMYKRFDAFVRECRIDDESTNYDCAIQELVEREYPTFDKLLSADPTCLYQLICRFCFDDLLQAFLGDSDPLKSRFAINSLNAIEDINGELYVKGDAYEIKSRSLPVRFEK